MVLCDAPSYPSKPLSLSLQSSWKQSSSFKVLICCQESGLKARATRQHLIWMSVLTGDFFFFFLLPISGFCPFLAKFPLPPSPLSLTQGPECFRVKIFGKQQIWINNVNVVEFSAISGECIMTHLRRFIAIDIINTRVFPRLHSFAKRPYKLTAISPGKRVK